MNQQAPPPIYKNPGLAAILSFFFMGLGQIYNGQIFKGVIFIIVYIISIILMIFLIGFITTPILFIWGIWDAYKSSEKINRQVASSQPVNNPTPGASL